ncbi:14660_t:CDS:1, partial [Funneliformis mosseae]
RVDNYGHERISAMPANNAYYLEQKPLPVPGNIYHYGQQMSIPENRNSNGNNQRSSIQNTDFDNLKNEIIQVVRQELAQNRYR